MAPTPSQSWYPTGRLSTLLLLHVIARVSSCSLLYQIRVSFMDASYKIAVRCITFSCRCYGPSSLSELISNWKVLWTSFGSFKSLPSACRADRHVFVALEKKGEWWWWSMRLREEECSRSDIGFWYFLFGMSVVAIYAFVLLGWQFASMDIARYFFDILLRRFEI